MTYSQNHEQSYILQHTPATGRFLDIGAWNARDKSNTRALYERGWSGVAVEPSPEPFLGLLREYGNDGRVELIHAAVASVPGLLRFHATADAVSTSNEAIFEKWRGVTTYVGIFHCPAITLEGIAEQFGEFDFVSIDAEGLSVELFERLLELGWRPSCICVEYDDQKEHVMELASRAGYAIRYISGENVVMSL